MTLPPTERDDFLALLDDSERAELERLGRLSRFARSEVLIRQGDPGDRVVILRSGRAKICFTTGEGRELVLRFCGPGQLVGELAVIDGSPRLSSVVAVEPVEALLVGAGDFRALLQTRPGFAVKLLAMLTRRFRQADLKRLEFGSSDTVGRVSARLVELAQEHGEPSPDGILITLPISQEELGGWTGSSRAGLANALRTLRELGWIDTERRRITVRDIGALAARAFIQK